MRNPVAEVNPAFTKLPKSDLKRIELVALLAIGVVDDRDASQLQFFRILSVLVGSFSDRLPAVFRQFGLGIETLHVRHAAVHEQPDDTLRLRSDMRLAIWGLPFCRNIRSNNSITCEHRSESQAGKSHTDICQERSSMHATVRTVACESRMMVHITFPAGRFVGENLALTCRFSIGSSQSRCDLTEPARHWSRPSVQCWVCSFFGRLPSIGSWNL